MNYGQIYICRVSGNAEQFDRWCGIQDRGIKVAVIGKSNGEANLIALRELVCGYQQVKHQLNRLTRWDRLQLALA
jgi:hypothetical protein